MKKSLLFVSALFLSAMGANAQIILTSADVASPIRVVYQANDTLLPASINEGSSGISQTWNMTTLTNGGVDTLTFMSAAWAPDASFPTSTMIMRQGWQSNFAYITNSASAFTNEGFKGIVDFGAGPTTFRQINSPAEKIMTFPATYLTAFTNNYTTTTPAVYFGIDPGIGFVVDSIRQHSEVKKSVNVDAWGSLTTPLGTFSVLRAEETIVRYDTTDAYIFGTWNDAIVTQADSTTGYSWWANGIGFPIVSMKLDSLGGVKQVQWLLANPVAGISEFTAPEMNVYPNPAQNEINFTVETSKASSVEVYDVAGRMIAVYAITNENAKLDISNFANGAYSFALLAKDKTVVNRGKFTVAK
ncbi:MAG: T9SS type A sorting domain-containing protein [Bacteroidetes bacterium]|nr:T9SS type A sorting domain-containing protein [Bacteroidota bacterium]